MMGASHRKGGEWVQGTALGAVTPSAKSLGRLLVFALQFAIILK